MGSTATPAGEPTTDRSALVTSLIAEHDLLDMGRAACERAGVPGREQAVAYCLAVLVQKRDPDERYGLAQDRSDFGRRLAEQADVVAQNLRRWGPAYQAIHDEADRFEITTLRRYVRTRLGDDVVDRVADALRDVLVCGVPLEDMTLQVAVDEEPAGNEYVFQSPLDGWIQLSAKRRFPRRLDELPPDLPGGDDLEEQIDAAAQDGEEQLALVVERVAELLETRDLLASLIERADRFDARFARRPSDPRAARQFARMRAVIATVADRLARERDMFQDMLAYVAIALRKAPRRQAVAMLSLRRTEIAADAVAAISDGLHAVLADAEQPQAALIRRTAAAAARDARTVPGSRATLLRQLHEQPQRRAELLEPVAALLRALPPRVEDNAAIAAAVPEPSDAHVVAVNRSSIAKELATVNEWMGSVYRRYAMGAA